MLAHAPLKENVLAQLRSKAVNANSVSDVDRVLVNIDPAPGPAKQYLLLLIVLSVASGAFAYLSVAASGKHDFHNASTYTLFATFSAMGLVSLLIFKMYHVYVRKRRERGEVVNNG